MENSNKDLIQSYILTQARYKFTVPEKRILYGIIELMQHYTEGKPLNKIGMKGQDTCELFFEDVRVPKENLLGTQGMGFFMLMQELAWERMLVAIICQAGAEAAFAHTV